jgi:hypothetical protein
VRKELLTKLRGQDSTDVKLFGDLVILVNPAVEADRFKDVHDRLKMGNYEECTPLAMVSFTSEADTALSDEFPKGMRIFYKDELKDKGNEALMTTAYGRYPEYSKYQLFVESPAAVEDSLSKSVFNRAALSWASFRNGDAPFELGAITLEKKKPSADSNNWEPILNVMVSKRLIAEHNEIWDPKFTYFLRGLVGMEFAKLGRCR